MSETYVTRNDECGSDGFDSIAWIFETHIKEPDTREFNFAILYGNEDSPSKIELWRGRFGGQEAPHYDTKPDRVWEVQS